MRHPIETTYVDYNKRPIRLFGSVTIPVSSNGWKIENATFLISENRTPQSQWNAIHNGLGACREQKIGPNVWASIAFASRFLNNAEGKYSTNELELLAVVCSGELFRTYLLGNRFQILTNH